MPGAFSSAFSSAFDIGAGGPSGFKAFWVQFGEGIGVNLMYPRNAASPEPIAIGAVVQISDGAVQTSGVTVRIKPIGVAEADGAGTPSYSTDGIVFYTPTQAETNYTSFILIAKKTGCIPVSVTIVTSASATAGQVRLEGVTHTGAVVPTVTNLTNLPSIPNNWITAAGIAADAITDAKVAADVTIASVTGSVGSVTGSVGSVTGNVGGNIVGNVNGSVASVANPVTVGTINANVITATSIASGAITNAKFAAGAIDAAALATDAVAEIADGVWDEPTLGHTTLGTYGLLLDDAQANIAEMLPLVQVLHDDWMNGGRLDLLLDGVKLWTDRLGTAMVLDGAVWQFTANALELGPSGSGGTSDWTADERTVIRSILGIPGSGTTPADPTTGILDTIRDLVVVVDTVADGIATQVGTAGSGLTAIPWNAAWDAEVQSECTDALNAYDPPTNAEMEARTLVAANYGTAANQTTILNRLGAWTGSGINTILGAFRALMAKASSLTPTDISTSTTYDNTTDSLEALRDRGDVAWVTGSGGGGGGSSSVILGSANTITRNINESIPIQFTWPSASATITATVELGTASAVACQGAVSFVRTDSAGKHWYQLAYDADDRPAVSGLARYVFTDGTSYFTVPVQFTEVASGAGSGTGARTVTINVNDGSNPIQNASVRLTLGAETFISTTNVSGQCTLNVDDGSYTVSITAAGYSFGGATLVVDGAETVTYSMTAVAFPVAAATGLCTVRFTFLKPDGTTPIQNVVVAAKLDQNVAVPASVISNQILYGTSSALGIVDLVLIQGASIKRGNKAYHITASDPQATSLVPLLDFRAVIPTASSINASSLVPLESR